MEKVIIKHGCPLRLFYCLKKLCISFSILFVFCLSKPLNISFAASSKILKISQKLNVVQ